MTRVKVRRGAAPPLPPGGRAPPRSRGRPARRPSPRGRAGAGAARSPPALPGGGRASAPGAPPRRRPPGARAGPSGFLQPPLAPGAGRSGAPSWVEGPRCPLHRLPLGRGCSQRSAGRAGCSARVCNRLPRRGCKMEASLRGVPSALRCAFSGCDRAVWSQRNSEQTARTGYQRRCCF